MTVDSVCARAGAHRSNAFIKRGRDCRIIRGLPCVTTVLTLHRLITNLISGDKKEKKVVEGPRVNRTDNANATSRQEEGWVFAQESLNFKRS